MKSRISVLFFILLFAAANAPAFQPDQLRLGLLCQGEPTECDPYPTAWRELSRALEAATSIETDPIFKEAIPAAPKTLKSHGLVFWMTSPEFKAFSASEKTALKNWVKLGGGTIVVMAGEGMKARSMPSNSDELDRRVRREIESVFEGSALEVIASTHAVFRSFYLVKRIGGVLERSKNLSGIRIGERYGLIYSRNDLLGTLLRGSEGGYLLECYPGGETQRKESFKLLVNIFLYVLTGTYKQDVIHIPFIEQKLRYR